MSDVVRLGVEDVEAYAKLRREMLHDAPWAFGSSPEDDRWRDVEVGRTGMGKPEHAILAVRDGLALVAAAGVMREEKLKRRHIAGIWGVYVAPAARGRGLARAVVGAAVEVAREWRGVTQVQLSVSEKAAAARRVYESLGFVVWGVEPAALRVGGATYSELHMSLTLA